MHKLLNEVENNIIIKDDGLNILQIDCKIDTFQNIQFKETKYHPEAAEIRTNFEDQYKYYYVNSDSLFIENTGLIKDIFVAVNLKGMVNSIYIFMESNLSVNNLLQKINETFENPKLKSKSSIEGINTNSKIYWNKNGNSVILTLNGRSKYPSISINSIWDVNKSGPSLFYY